MIKSGARLDIRRIPLEDLHVTEYQARYPERVMHYVKLVQEHPHDDPGLIHVQRDREFTYEILDGHHRYCALILTGRPDALCLVIDESGAEEP